jgi:hypothetical protein
MFTHRQIEAAIASVNPEEFAGGNLQLVQPVSLLAIVVKIVAISRGLIPFFVTVSSSALFPPATRAVLTAFIQGIDILAAMTAQAAPAAESAVSDGTTTTDPTSTDPSFKAGKDL